MKKIIELLQDAETRPLVIACIVGALFVVGMLVVDHLSRYPR